MATFVGTTSSLSSARKMTKFNMEKTLKLKKITFRRKWTHEECLKILSFLRTNRYEQPNGTVFYKRLTREHKFSVDWQLVRCKVRNLRISYLKANSLLAAHSKGNLKMRNGELLSSVISKVCPYYKELHEILKDEPPPVPRKRPENGFGHKMKTMCIEPKSTKDLWQIESLDDAEVDVDSLQLPCDIEVPRYYSTTASTSTAATVPLPLDMEIVKEEPESSAYSYSTDTTPIPNISSVYGAAEACEVQVKEDASEPEQPNRCNNSFMRMQPQQQLQQEELDYQRQLRWKELQLREKELDIRQYEVETNERLVRLRLESKERIAMKRLELKYRHK